MPSHAKFPRPALFSARETLAELYRNRLGAIRDDAPGGHWVDVSNFGIPINESIPDRAERMRRCMEYLPVVSAPGSSAAGVGVRPSAPAATNMENE